MNSEDQTMNNDHVYCRWETYLPDDDYTVLESGYGYTPQECAQEAAFRMRLTDNPEIKARVYVLNWCLSVEQ